jgi:hypothetical protein
MDDISSFRDRTDAKLRFARLHLEELSSREVINGDDFERAHQEAFLFQLFGARDALVAELAIRYGADQSKGRRVNDLRKSLQSQGVQSSEIAEIDRLAKDNGNWLNLAREMRNHGTHEQGVSRAFHLGGPKHGKVQLRDPRDRNILTDHYVDEFGKWLGEMSTLVGKLRASADRRSP